MQIFRCQNCGNTLFFENTLCENCGMALGYLPAAGTLSALRPDNELWYALGDERQGAWRYCSNQQHGVCNWLVEAASVESLCIACRLNRYIPNLNTASQQESWRELEFAKHRLVYSLLRLGLPVVSKAARPEEGLAFDFVSGEAAVPEDAEVTTGHTAGRITINAAEGDPVAREQMREAMGERYRTLIGHFRHEVGHYYWDRLIAPYPDIGERFRALFGDERDDYQEALGRHYQTGAPADWQQHFVSRYASTHPWEDWAETWAHYLHLIDTLETAYAFGLSTTPRGGHPPGMSMQADIDPYTHANFQDMIDRYLPLTLAVNSLNRSMGQPDLYPFLLPDAVRSKLQFVHDLLRNAR
ncbi:MAG: putative zinc-binding metallopeptidase [Parahaliea sp.]